MWFYINKLCCIALLYNLYFANCYNYCEKENIEIICENETHFMCDPSSVPSKGQFITHVPMTRKLRKHILAKFNAYRNRIAGAVEIPKFPKAAAMREVMWDDELEHIAYTHASRCSHKESKCHGTLRFPNAGQAIGHKTDQYPMRVLTTIDEILNDMYSQKDRISDAAAMPNGFDPVAHKHARYFTNMMSDQLSRLGCAIAYCRKCDAQEHCFCMTCMFDTSNVPNKRIFKTADQSASLCNVWKTGASTQFPNLCKNNGRIYTTPWGERKLC